MPSDTRQTLIQQFIDRAQIAWYQYSVTIPVYRMNPYENLVTNSLVFAFLSLLVWAVLLYFPLLLFRKVSQLVWLLTQNSGNDTESVLAIVGSSVSSYAPATTTVTLAT
jgi:hypothetical protein